MKREALVVGLVLLLAFTGVAGAQARGKPVLLASLPDGSVDPGESTALSLTIANEGDLDWASTTNPGLTEQVTTARGITARIDADDAPFTVETGEQLVGSLPGGGSTTVPFRIHVDETAEPGRYEVPVEFEYRYTSYISRNGVAFEEDARVERTVTVTVEPAARFEVVGASDSVRSGETGQVSVTLENTGTATARNSSVAMASPDTGLTFGTEGARQSSRFTGRWAPGERRSLTYRVRADEARTDRTFTLDAQVAYRDDDGDPRESRAVTVGVRAASTPAFAFENVTTSLRVDDRGTVAGTVLNDGSTRVRNAVVHFRSNAAGITPRMTAQSVGDLAPGERASFAFDVDVAGGVAAGTYQVSLQPGYDGSETAGLTGDPRNVRVAVESEREPFDLEVVNGTVAPDTDNYRFGVDVSNVGDVPREEVVLRLSAGPPFTSTTPAVHVSSLSPGETSRVVFDLSVGEDAVAGSYPVFVNVTSDSPDRDQSIDGPYLVPVSVVEPSEGPTDLGITAVAGLLVVIVLGIGWWWLRE